MPGRQNVLNCLEAVPPEEDNDYEVTDAVRLLEKDPFVKAGHEAVKEAAEFDAWYVFGVDKVTNKLEVENE